MQPTTMLIGLGDLGSVLLELLAREEGVGRIVVGSRDRERGAARCNLARLGAIAQGYDTTISFVPLDLTNSDMVAEVVHREAPDVILTTATMQTWWLPDLLPEPQATLIKNAGFGVWLPVHLALCLKLMDALRDAGYRGLTLTAPFPDVVNHVLGQLDLAPTCGVGNIGEIVPKVRLLAARRLGAPIESVRVFLVAHHALQRATLWGGTGEVPPYFLRVERDGEDVTEMVRPGELLLGRLPVASGRVIHFLTAGATVRLIRALHSDDETLLHAPGPNGLPGGYPILASRDGVRLAPLSGLSHEEAIAINELSHRFDGIERVEPDGTVVFGPAGVDVLREQLGYECDRMQPTDVEHRADELVARFREYAKRYGVDV